MLDELPLSPHLRARLQAGPAAAHLEGFCNWLLVRGYKPSGVTSLFYSLANWSDWAKHRESLVQGLPEAVEASRNAVDQGPPHRRYALTQKAVGVAGLLVRYLQEQGDVPRPVAAPHPHDRWPVLGDFRSWMVNHRGVTQETINVYQRLLIEMLQVLGGATETFSVERIRAFVLKRTENCGIATAKNVGFAVRAFLRFLGATGRGPVGMEYAVPRCASWKLQSIPRYLDQADVQRVVESCQPSQENGLRDRAVILLLARLGLRASDVANLSLRDIDWNNGRIAVCGKGRRQEWLPLPQEVGDALLQYILEARPKLKLGSVFARDYAPAGPLTRAAVTHIVQRAIKRAGVQTPFKGAHVLRHSAATAMLRQGVSLAGVGAVLRHRSPDTTLLYAKVDMALLSTVAQPWPEVPSC